MFGHLKRKRERKAAKQNSAAIPQHTGNYEAQKSQIDQRAQEAKNVRQQGRKEGREYARDVFANPPEGLDPEQRRNMQFEANQMIQRQHQAANRKLLGEQSRHGILGKGGVGYAQQRDLMRMANEHQGQATRDISRINHDLALKKQAAMFGIEQGEAGQAQLDRQLAADEIRLEEELKRQRYKEDHFNNIFNRA